MNSQYLIIVLFVVIIFGLGISVVLYVSQKHKDIIASNVDFPALTLCNDVIEADVFLPDKDKGYYRGVRFDWSGMVDQVRFNGHTFFYDHNMKIYEPSFGRGTAEEFSMGICGLPGPLGYEDANQGQGFLKIGVGVLEKDSNDEIYNFGKSYKILDSGVWHTSYTKSRVKFIHEIKDFNGWGYRYTKRVSLIEDRPELLVERELENTGINTIDTVHYCHNFVIIDNMPIGQEYTLRFPFEPRIFKGKLRDYIKLNNNKVMFSDVIPVKENIWVAMEGFGQTNSDNSFVIENKKSGVGMRIEGDLPMRRFHLYIEKTMLCPESFVPLIIVPGEKINWQTKYSFYEK